MTAKTRRRQANGRPNRVHVSLTDDQYKAWRAAADDDQITIQRWMVDRLTDKPPTMITRALVTQLGGIRLGATGTFGNLNQLAHRAHLEGVDLTGWLVTVADIARLVAATEEWITEHS